MSHKIIQKMPTVEEIVARHPLSTQAEAQIVQDRKEIGNILAGRDSRLLFIAGPCSAWPSESVLAFAERLKKLSDELKDSLKIVMRVYIQKPRTIRGWLGPVNQPDPYEPPDIAKGAEYCRDMMVQAIEMGLPIADEALFTHNARGFAELLSWMAIGARSVEDQEHRIFASAADCPVGMKNATSGSIEVAVNGIIAAQHPHHTTFDGHQIQTDGNPFAHLVLRGGFRGSNYDPVHVHKAGALFEKHKVKNPAIIVDASHDNCKVDGVKVSSRQAEVVKESLAFMHSDAQYRRLVKGFMIESFLKEGSQKLESATPDTIDRGGLSITDPCLGWEATETLLREVAAAHV